MCSARRPSASARYSRVYRSVLPSCFFLNDTATTEIYTLSLHDALPISPCGGCVATRPSVRTAPPRRSPTERSEEHTSDSSHQIISYAVFCLKKKKKLFSVVRNKKKRNTKKTKNEHQDHQ